jgi:hypothetical protein
MLGIHLEGRGDTLLSPQGDINLGFSNTQLLH